MWVRKSEEEIQELLLQKEARKEILKKNLARPLLFAAAFGTVVMLLYSLGIRGCTRGIALVSGRNDGFNSRTIFAGIFMFALIAAVSIYRQRKHGYFFGGDEDFARCEKCTETAHANPDNVCPACGGKQEPTDFYSWVDDEVEKREATGETNKGERFNQPIL